MNEFPDTDSLSPFVPDFSILRKVREAADCTVSALVDLTGLDPATAFRYSDLRGVDWRGSEVAGLNIDGARIDALPSS